MCLHRGFCEEAAKGQEFALRRTRRKPPAPKLLENPLKPNPNPSQTCTTSAAAPAQLGDLLEQGFGGIRAGGGARGTSSDPTESTGRGSSTFRGFSEQPSWPELSEVHRCSCGERRFLPSCRGRTVRLMVPEQGGTCWAPRGVISTPSSSRFSQGEAQNEEGCPQKAKS